MTWHIGIGGVKHEFYTTSLYNLISYIFIYIYIYIYLFFLFSFLESGIEDINYLKKCNEFVHKHLDWKVYFLSFLSKKKEKYINFGKKGIYFYFYHQSIQWICFLLLQNANTLGLSMSKCESLSTLAVWH